MAQARRRTLSLLLAAGLACAAPPADPRPSVLLITVDTLRADHLGSYGFPGPVSPHVDALARSGVVFERAIAASGATAPSHASIMTSRFTREHSIGYLNGTSRLAGLPTLATVFREAGWETGAFVGNMVLRRSSGLDDGFDVYDDELGQLERNRSHVFERTAEATTGRAQHWLAARGGDAPFFLWVHYQDPHGPYTPPPPYAERFAAPPASAEKPLPVLPNDTGWGGIPAYQALDGVFHPSAYRSRYAGEVSYADASIGRLVESADAAAGRRPLVVLLTADHGESLGEADRWFVHFHTTTPEIAHVPLVLRAPGLPPGRRSELVHHVDVMPTLLELAGLPVPEGARGIALGPHLREPARALPERTLYCDAGRELSAYRGDTFTRLMGTEGAWIAPEREVAPAEPLAIDHRWRVTPGSGPEWERVVGGGEVEPAARAYAADAVPMRRAGELDAETRTRLRALGYSAD